VSGSDKNEPEKKRYRKTETAGAVIDGCCVLGCLADLFFLGSVVLAPGLLLVRALRRRGAGGR